MDKLTPLKLIKIYLMKKKGNKKMNNLLNEFEKMLDNEAKKVVNEMVSMYHKRIIVNKSYEQVVRDLLPKELQYYIVDIEMRTFQFLPDEFRPDFNNEYTLSKKEEYIEDHILKYCEYCRNRKDHLKIAKQMAEKLVDYLTKNPNSNKGILELTANWTEELLPEHNDSVDAQAIILFLQNELENLGYKIVELNPLIIEKNIY